MNCLRVKCAEAIAEGEISCSYIVRYHIFKGRSALKVKNIKVWSDLSGKIRQMALHYVEKNDFFLKCNDLKAGNMGYGSVFLIQTTFLNEQGQINLSSVVHLSITQLRKKKHKWKV